MRITLIILGTLFCSQTFAQSPFEGLLQSIPNDIKNEIMNSKEFKALESLQKANGGNTIPGIDQIKTIIQTSGNQQKIQTLLQNKQVQELIKGNTGDIKKSENNTQNFSTGILTTGIEKTNTPKQTQEIIGSFTTVIRTLPQTKLKIIRENLIHKLNTTTNKKLKTQLLKMQSELQLLIKNY